MKRRNASFPKSVLLGAGAAASIPGCGEQEAPVSEAEQKDAEEPGAVAIKDSVRDAYSYASPMLMNYDVQPVDIIWKPAAIVQAS